MCEYDVSKQSDDTRPEAEEKEEQQVIDLTYRYTMSKRSDGTRASPRKNLSAPTMTRGAGCRTASATRFTVRASVHIFLRYSSVITASAFFAAASFSSLKQEQVLLPPPRQRRILDCCFLN